MDRTVRTQQNLLKSNKAELLIPSHAVREETLPPPDPQPDSLKHGKKYKGVPPLSRGNTREQFDENSLNHFFKDTLNRSEKDCSLLFRIEHELINLANDSKRTMHKFPNMSSYERMLVHRVAAYFNMEHNVDKNGSSVIVTTTKSTRIPESRFCDLVLNQRVLKDLSHKKDDALRTNLLRPSVVTSHIFNGYEPQQQQQQQQQTTAQSDYILTKQGCSMSSSCILPTSSGYKSQRSDAILSTIPSPTIKPQTQIGNPYTNPDGTVYHYDFNNPPLAVTETQSHDSPQVKSYQHTVQSPAKHGESRKKKQRKNKNSNKNQNTGLPATQNSVSLHSPKNNPEENVDIKKNLAPHNDKPNPNCSTLEKLYSDYIGEKNIYHDYILFLNFFNLSKIKQRNLGFLPQNGYLPPYSIFQGPTTVAQELHSNPYQMQDFLPLAQKPNYINNSSSFQLPPAQIPQMCPQIPIIQEPPPHLVGSQELPTYLCDQIASFEEHPMYVPYTQGPLNVEPNNEIHPHFEGPPPGMMPCMYKVDWFTHNGTTYFYY